MMDSSQALATAGLPDPGGDPAAMAAQARHWHEMANALRRGANGLTELSANSASHWQGPDADSFRAQVFALSEKSGTFAHTASVVGAEQQAHAERHQTALVLIKEIGIQLAAALAYWAAAAAFPPLLAGAQAWLSALIVQGSRVLQWLTRALAAFARLMVQARTWIQQVMAMSWRTEWFTLGIGRGVTEAVRDAFVETLAFLTTAGVLGKRIDPVELLKNVVVGGLVGGMLGTLEKSGLTKLLDEAGEIRRAVDGKPVFTTFSDQAKAFVKKVGGPPAPTVSTPVPPLFQRFRDAEARVHAVGLRTTGTGEQVSASLRAAERELTRLRSLQTDAEVVAGRLASEASTHLDEVERTTRRVRDTMARVTTAQDAELATALRARDEAVDAHRRAVVASDTASARARDADVTARRARVDADTEAGRVARLSDQHDASRELDEARSALRDGTTDLERFRHFVEHNPWRESFGTPKWWQEVVLYDTPRYFVKGFVSNAAKAGVDVHLGTAAPGDIWWRALLGGGTSALRGLFNGSLANTVFPQFGPAETVWKTASKSIDNLVSTKVGEAHR